MNTEKIKSNDTIAAISTAVGGAVAILRVSGPEAVMLVGNCWRGQKTLLELAPRELHLGVIQGEDNKTIDHCLGVRFTAPHSYTGEDMVEIHCHGGALTARAILMRIFDSGARHAEPGEFTKRAFLNGKMDLTQAEAVGDIIEAQTEMALHIANRQLDGLLGRQVNELYERLLHILSEIESQMDFSGEDLEWMPLAEMGTRLGESLQQVNQLLANRREGEILRNGVRLVIAGAPNVGKSSLLNAILGRDRAIVTDIPGTTRDTLEELAHIRGIPVRLIDTAGIREAEDLIEQSGIERSVSSLHEAQIVLWVFEAGATPDTRRCPYELQHAPVIAVGNKMDKAETERFQNGGNLQNIVYTCALTGQGMDELFDAIEQAVWDNPQTREPEVAVSSRHAALLDQAREHLTAAQAQCKTQAWELVAVGLRGALDTLGQISGKTTSPDILEQIFSRFCIGK
ncbi:MAG: tRNA uridine-5-carboxymethylaminomethyl(34) synthesis GTPase MnmE [Lentisphaeria bacterium]